ncbi:MAG: riboflavin synthase [Crocosphaera sp.]
MFTGLIQGLGIIRPLESNRFTLSISDAPYSTILSDLAIGDSVAVDGVCLTVEEILSEGFVATASPETLERTTITQKIQTASYVNLEPSLRVGSKLGGHFVTGHVDGFGCLQESLATDTAWEMTFSAPSSRLEQWQDYIEPYLIPKGSVAVNGISLTVAECDPAGTWFKAAVIPHTYSETNLCYLKTGDWVNIEGDILGKYVAKLLGKQPKPSQSVSEINLTFLTENGYL